MFKGLSMLLLSVASIGAFATPTAKDDIEINPLKAASGEEVVYKMDFDYQGDEKLLSSQIYKGANFDFDDKSHFAISNHDLVSVVVGKSSTSDAFYLDAIAGNNYSYLNINLTDADLIIASLNCTIKNVSNENATINVNGYNEDFHINETRNVNSWVMDTSLQFYTSMDFEVGKIEVTCIKPEYIPTYFSKQFLDLTHQECLNAGTSKEGISEETWTNLTILFNQIGKSQKYDNQVLEIMLAEPNEQGDELGQMMARYVMICNKYNKDNFLESDFVNKSLQPHTYLDYANIVIVSFSSIVLVAVVSFAIIKANKVKKAR